MKFWGDFDDTMGMPAKTTKVGFVCFPSRLKNRSKSKDWTALKLSTTFPYLVWVRLFLRHTN